MYLVVKIPYSVAGSNQAAAARALFEQLDRATRRGRGIVRDTYGAGEQAAHDIMHAAAENLAREEIPMFMAIRAVKVYPQTSAG